MYVGLLHDLVLCIAAYIILFLYIGQNCILFSSMLVAIWLFAFCLGEMEGQVSIRKAGSMVFPMEGSMSDCYRLKSFRRSFLCVFGMFHASFKYIGSDSFFRLFGEHSTDYTLFACSCQEGLMYMADSTRGRIILPFAL